VVLVVHRVVLDHERRSITGIAILFDLYLAIRDLDDRPVDGIATGSEFVCAAIVM
jgi:hypothetical protein